MKTYWGRGSIAPRILDLGTRWRWLVRFTPGGFTPRGRAPGTHWIRGWVGPRAGLDAVVKRKIPNPLIIKSQFFNWGTSSSWSEA